MAMQLANYQRCSVALIILDNDQLYFHAADPPKNIIELYHFPPLFAVSSKPIVSFPIMPVGEGKNIRKTLHIYKNIKCNHINGTNPLLQAGDLRMAPGNQSYPHLPAEKIQLFFLQGNTLLNEIARASVLMHLLRRNRKISSVYRCTYVKNLELIQP
jgi:hypothetical protein